MALHRSGVCTGRGAALRVAIWCATQRRTPASPPPPPLVPATFPSPMELLASREAALCGRGPPALRQASLLPRPWQALVERGRRTAGLPGTPVRGRGAAANIGCLCVHVTSLSCGCHPGGLAGLRHPGTAAPALLPRRSAVLCLAAVLKAPVGPHVHKRLLRQAFILAESALMLESVKLAASGKG